MTGKAGARIGGGCSRDPASPIALIRLFVGIGISL